MKHPILLRFSLLAALAFAGLAVAPNPASADEVPTLEQARSDLKGIKAHVSNATMRVRHGGQEFSPSDPDGSRTPAMSCCRPSLDRIGQKLQNLNKISEQWYRHFANEGNQDAVAKIGEVRAQLQEVSKGVAQFRMAGTVERAVQALQGTIRPYLALEEATLAMEAWLPQPAEKP